MYFIQTNDVELTSIAKNRSDINMANKVLKIGQPRLLDLYSKYDVESTFFFTGDIIEAEPELIDITKERGHEIACHGYDHDSRRGFDTKDLNFQIEEIEKCKRIFKEHGCSEVKSFKSPELRINFETPKALEKTGFSVDCSVASQRFDGPFSYGTKFKKNWMFSPRKPYFMDINNPFRRGNSNILEIPISGFFLPYIGTFMRIQPKFFSYFEKALFKESEITGKPMVFIFHPNECIREKEVSRNYISRGSSGFFRDRLRQDIKMKNLGINAIKLMERSLKRAKKHGFEFISAIKYKEKIHR